MEIFIQRKLNSRGLKQTSNIIQPFLWSFLKLFFTQTYPFYHVIPFFFSLAPYEYIIVFHYPAFYF